ncbi:hypothetical protein C8Q76DRAFT_626958 [Earliella scabrosa]|nr:hypothetical protein C8Q76DRAFT_626958 [Earliella scabrosa]
MSTVTGEHESSRKLHRSDKQSVNRAILPVLWPNGLGRADTCGVSQQVTDDWWYVPESLDAIYDWASVGSDDGEDPSARRERRYLLYQASMLPEADRGVECTVTLVVQGFIVRCALSPMGMWKGREKDAPGAVQYVVLDGGPYPEVFAHQLRAVRDLHEFVCTHTGPTSGKTAIEGDSLVLERMVFTKVRVVDDQRTGIQLDARSDPRGHARKIASKWRIDHVVRTGMRRANGQNVLIAHEAIQPGDFVEVSVALDIRVMRTKTARTTVIQFAPQEVVRLWSAADIQVSCCHKHVPHYAH